MHANITRTHAHMYARIWKREHVVVVDVVVVAVDNNFELVTTCSRLTPRVAQRMYAWLYIVMCAICMRGDWRESVGMCTHAFFQVCGWLVFDQVTTVAVASKCSRKQ